MEALIIEKGKVQELLNNALDNVFIEDFIEQLIILPKLKKHWIN